MSNGTFTQFLDALRAFESGVDYDRYLSGQITEAQIRSWVGDANWNAYQAGQLTWRDMQYTSVNSLGFVGYQFGEPLLIDLGYYLDNTGNLWTGRFTGKNGVDSFATLKTDIQETIIPDAFGYNLNVIESGLEAKGTNLDALIGSQRTYVDTNGQNVTVTLTLTGILAAAHLRGAWGTLDLLNNGSASADEYGTSILKYIQQFGAYDTPSYSTLIAAHQAGKTLSLAEELWHDDFNGDGAVSDYAGWDGTQADGGSTGGSTGGETRGGGQTGGDGAATVTTISWMWGTNTVLAFDPDLDVLDFGWFQKDNFSIAEVAGSVVITIAGNNQTYKLDGVTLAELSMANIRAKDAGTVEEWVEALETAEPAMPGLSIADVSVKEGNSGTRLMTFTVTLSTAAAGPVTVAYSTADGTATSGSDYVAASGNLTFAAGEISKTITVKVKGDKVAEGNEAFTVRLGNAAGATIADGSATGTITNDDAAAKLPALSVGDVSLREGDSGTAELMFVVTLDKAATSRVTVNYATTDGTATAGSDYAALAGKLTFAPGETSKMVHVAVKGDTVVEANETFSLTLSGARGTTIADATAVGQLTGLGEIVLRHTDVATGLATLATAGAWNVAADEAPGVAVPQRPGALGIVGLGQREVEAAPQQPAGSQIAKPAAGLFVRRERQPVAEQRQLQRLQAPAAAQHLGAGLAHDQQPLETIDQRTADGDLIARQGAARLFIVPGRAIRRQTAVVGAGAVCVIGGREDPGTAAAQVEARMLGAVELLDQPGAQRGKAALGRRRRAAAGTHQEVLARGGLPRQPHAGQPEGVLQEPGVELGAQIVQRSDHLRRVRCHDQELARRVDDLTGRRQPERVEDAQRRQLGEQRDLERAPAQQLGSLLAGVAATGEDEILNPEEVALDQQELSFGIVAALAQTGGGAVVGLPGSFMPAPQSCRKRGGRPRMVVKRDFGLDIEGCCRRDGMGHRQPQAVEMIEPQRQLLAMRGWDGFQTSQEPLPQAGVFGLRRLAVLGFAAGGLLRKQTGR